MDHEPAGPRSFVWLHRAQRVIGYLMKPLFRDNGQPHERRFVFCDFGLRRFVDQSPIRSVDHLNRDGIVDNCWCLVLDHHVLCFDSKLEVLFLLVSRKWLDLNFLLRFSCLCDF